MLASRLLIFFLNFYLVWRIKTVSPICVRYVQTRTISPLSWTVYQVIPRTHCTPKIPHISSGLEILSTSAFDMMTLIQVNALCLLIYELCRPVTIWRKSTRIWYNPNESIWLRVTSGVSCIRIYMLVGSIIPLRIILYFAPLSLRNPTS